MFSLYHQSSCSAVLGIPLNTLFGTVASIWFGIWGVMDLG